MDTCPSHAPAPGVGFDLWGERCSAWLRALGCFHVAEGGLGMAGLSLGSAWITVITSSDLEPEGPCVPSVHGVSTPVSPTACGVSSMGSACLSHTKETMQCGRSGVHLLSRALLTHCWTWVIGTGIFVPGMGPGLFSALTFVPSWQRGRGSGRVRKGIPVAPVSA